MAYTTYITDALVCGSRASNTADRSFLLFTRDAGMLYASAKSVREERSKQRFGLQEFSYIRVTLVHGKAGWRITGAEPVVNVYARQETREARALVRNVIKLLRRLIQGEAAHEALFDEVRAVLDHTHSEHERALEEILTIRTLHMLGYIAPRPELAPLLADTPIFALIPELDRVPAELRTAVITEALRESHL